jgi:putative tricarboxylic transport membrane protein
MRHLNYKNTFIGILAITFVLFLHLTANGANPADDYPNKPISYVTHSSPAGGPAIYGQLLDKIMKEEKILSQPMVVVFKPGSGAGAALGYVFEKKGNPYVILAVTSSTLLGTPLREKLPYTYKSFTPICNFIADGSVLVVRKDSPLKTIDDLISEARKRPKQLTQAGASFGANDSLMGKAIQKVKGVQWEFISFPGDSEATLAVLSGNADFQFVNPYSIVEHVEAGNLRVLLNLAHSRYDAFKNVPTIKEAGLGDPITLYRGIAGPPDMPEYAVKKLEAAFKKATGSLQFKKYIDANMMQSLWLSSNEYGKFLDEESVRYKGWLDEVGLLKNK